VSEDLERLPQRLAFASALELVMRRLHPPHARLPGLVRPQDLGLPEAALRADPALLAYRYLRGLDTDAAAPPAPGAATWWCRGHALMGPFSALEEWRPGLLALATVEGALHLITASRGEWEVLDTLNVGSAQVTALVALSDTELLVLAGEGFVGIVDAGPDGRWRCRPVAWSPYPVGGYEPRVACRMGDGTWRVGGRGGEALLQRLPSGEWKAAFSGGPGMRALVSLPGGRWLQMDDSPTPGPPMVMQPIEGGGSQGRSLPVSMEGGITAVAEWDAGQGLVLGSGGGQVLLLPGPTLEGLLAGAMAPTPIGLSSTPIIFLRAWPGGRLLTGHGDGRRRLWREAGGRLELVAELGISHVPDVARHAMLCDGRLAVAEFDAVSTFAPDAGGVWREQRLFATLEQAPTLGVLLGGGTLACLIGTQLHWFDLDGLDLRLAASASLPGPVLDMKVVDGDTLAVLQRDGAVDLWSRPEGRNPWSARRLLEPVGEPVRGSHWHWLAAARGHVLRVTHVGPPGELQPNVFLLRQAGADWAEVVVYAAPPGVCSAAAVDDEGHCAIAVGGQLRLLHNQSWVSPPGQTAGSWVPHGLHTLGGGGFLALEASGQSKIVTTEAHQAVPLPWLPGDAAWRAAVVPGSDDAMNGAPPLLLAARGSTGLQVLPLQPMSGTSAMAVPSALAIYDVRGPVDRVQARGSQVAVSAAMLYVIDRHAAGDDALRSIVVEEGVSVVCALSPDGRIRRLHARRLDGQPWTTRLVGGRAEPDDPLLARQVALLGRDGRLEHLSRGARYSFSADRSTFIAEDDA
jgi:hypothetical protein